MEEAIMDKYILDGGTSEERMSEDTAFLKKLTPEEIARSESSEFDYLEEE